MSTDWPVQFKIDGDPLGDICHLSDCTCEELLKQAKSQLIQYDHKLRGYDIKIKDDDEVEYGSDDDDLEEAFGLLEENDGPLSMTIILVKGI